MPNETPYSGDPLFKPLCILATLMRALENCVLAVNEAGFRRAGEVLRGAKAFEYKLELANFGQILWKQAQAAGYTRADVVRVTSSLSAAYTCIVLAPGNPRRLRRWDPVDRAEVIRRLELRDEEQLRLDEWALFRQANTEVFSEPDTRMQVASDELSPMVTAINDDFRNKSLAESRTVEADTLPSESHNQIIQSAPLPEYMSAKDLASHLRLDPDAVRKRLERLSEKHDIRVELEAGSRRTRTVKYMYVTAVVLPLLNPVAEKRP